MADIQEVGLECVLPDGDFLVKRLPESGRRVPHPVPDGRKGYARLLASYANAVINAFPGTDFTGVTFRVLTFSGDVPEQIDEILATLTIREGEE